ncbi:hypothetical protein HK103_000566 [Boothiomyces macroporosus]|uniref:Uncharacterized protein n=1 Tax=Boothiomyces macroporosus TaxID=261099 RepID=A0AAD5UKC0_9FUNG|nr:hypothetical protein HK103_000566 [Boothiomyces macroporosus]
MDDDEIIESESFLENQNAESVNDESEIVDQPTVKEMQEALNKSHPFGIKIWKPALYPKHRSIDTKTYQALHSIPGQRSSQFTAGNIFWALLFGWWIALVYILTSILLFAPIWILGITGSGLLKCFGFERGKMVEEMEIFGEYMKVLMNLSGYILWPFNKFVARVITGDAIPDIYSEMPPAEIPLMADNNYNQDDIQIEVDQQVPSSSTLAGPGRIRRDDYLNNQSHFDSEESWSEESSRNEHDSLLASLRHMLKKTYTRGFTRFYFSLVAWIILTPLHILVSGVCYFLILPIPMGKTSYYLLRHLYRHPLKLVAKHCDSFSENSNLHHFGEGYTAESSVSLQPPEDHLSASGRPKSYYYWSQETALTTKTPAINQENEGNSLNILPPIIATPSLSSTRNYVNSSHKEYQIVLCIYHAMGIEYFKYTIGGINIIFINLLSMIVFTLVDFYIIGPQNGYTGIADKMIIFFAGLLSTVPLAFFIGMAVSSITAETGSVAVGSVINATFGSIIEIILYAFGLMEGKEELVQGAMIGSFLVGLLALPGVSMFSGGIKRTEQRFNIKSASVTSTMLLVSVVGVFTPTLFQNIHGTYEFICKSCPVKETGQSCKECRIYQPHPTEDPIYKSSTRPLMYICAVILLLTYAVGLWFTLRTHAAHIYPEKKKKTPRLPTIELEATLVSPHPESSQPERSSHPQRRKIGRTKSVVSNTSTNPSIRKRRNHLSKLKTTPLNTSHHAPSTPVDNSSESSSDDEGHGHGNPGWDLAKSAGILLGCTVAYSLIAEVLIDSLDEILEILPLSEKTLGLTIFAIVPTVTEFYNAIAFAVGGNIVLSLEIGSAYAIQAALLQIPALVGFSALWNSYGRPLIDTPIPGKYIQGAFQLAAVPFTKTDESASKVNYQFTSEFTLVFPRWEFYTILFSVFLLTYVYLEGKSNYFKGALLLLTYIILIVAFFFEPDISGSSIPYTVMAM